MLAHQGGWDETLLIIGPVLVIVGLLWLAKRRVDRQQSVARETADPETTARANRDEP